MLDMSENHSRFQTELDSLMAFLVAFAVALAVCLVAVRIAGPGQYNHTDTLGPGSFVVTFWLITLRNRIRREPRR